MYPFLLNQTQKRLRRAPVQPQIIPYTTTAGFNNIGGPGNDVITINTGGSSGGTPGPVGPQGPTGNTGPQGPTGNTGPAANINFVTLTNINTDYTATANDYYLCVDTLANPVNITLPVGLLGRVYVIKDCGGNSSINPIKINGTGETIDGSNAIINSDYGSTSFIFNGTEWNTI